MKLATALAVLLAALLLGGCQTDCNAITPLGASGPFGGECDQPVYTATCGPGATPWTPDQGFGNTGEDGNFDKFWDKVFGCEPEFQPMASPRSACAPAAAPVAAAAGPTPCGPLPPEARPGETWCCVKVQPPAAAPRQVCTRQACRVAIPVPAVMGSQSRQVLVSQATTRWERVDCPQQSTETVCWTLKEVPAVYRTETYDVVVTPASTRYKEIPPEYKMVASAAPPAYWEWRKTDGCQPPAAAPGCAPGTPPAGAVVEVK